MHRDYFSIMLVSSCILAMHRDYFSITLVSSCNKPHFCCTSSKLSVFSISSVNFLFFQLSCCLFHFLIDLMLPELCIIFRTSFLVKETETAIKIYEVQILTRPKIQAHRQSYLEPYICDSRALLLHRSE
jgi:hypothetical protein